MSDAFEPIAIVGRACLFPGARDIEAFWSLLAEGRDATGPAPTGRWRVRPDRFLAAAGDDAVEAATCDRGGYVLGFEDGFDPNGFGVPAEHLLALDPTVHWLAHVGRHALADAGYSAAPARCGGAIGLLSLPSDGYTAWAEDVWLADAPARMVAAAQRGRGAASPWGRFMSGYPAHVLATALGLDLGAFALDAACASSLYAIKLAADRLHDGAADAMLAGAVCRSDDLFIHVGFSALRALSPSGRSRPFHAGADGLLPAEGAGIVVLRRLADAVAAGQRIHGVIRGVGLSNDGRSRGFLAPAADGQVQAMRAAYAMSGLAPADIGYVECHATGTPIGDPVEIASLGRVFEGCDGLPLGSVKSNIGHPLTAAGMASLFKVLGAMEHGVLPPTIHLDALHGAVAASPFRVVDAAERWAGDGPRRAAINAFGFGGNNAHLLVEQWDGRRPTPRRATPPSGGPLAVVGLGVVAADAPDAAAFARALATGEGCADGAVADVALDLRAVRFPPDDLRRALPQQLIVLKAVEEAVHGLAPLPRARTADFVAMGCDTEIARYGLRMRLADWAPDASPGWRAEAAARANGPLVAASVVGALPNVVANRVNVALDAAGVGFTVSGEQASGLVALRLAARALAVGECDVAVVAAADVCCEPVHAAAARAVLDPAQGPPGDAAVAIVLRRLDDARRDGDDVLALVPVDAAADSDETVPPLARLFGHAHAAAGLLHVAAAIVACRHGIAFDGVGAGPLLAPVAGRAVAATVPVLGAADETAWVRATDAATPRPLLLTPPPHLQVFAGQTAAAALQAARDGRAAPDGPARLVVVGSSEDELAARRARAINLIEAGSSLPPGEGAQLRERPIGGDVAFVFPGAAAAYAGMGRTLALAFPDVLAAMRARVPGLDRIAGWVYDAARERPPSASEKLWGSSFLCQFHAILAQEVLGIRAQAAIGVSSGETNALFAMGAWHDIAAFHDRLDGARLFEASLGGTHDVLAGLGLPRAWSAWRVLASEDELAGLLAAEPALRHTITNAPGDAVIAGPPEACRRAIARLGEARARPLDYDFVAHCREVAPFADDWRRLHTWPTRPVGGVRFYTHATGGAYAPTEQSAADALTVQALRHIDFPALVTQAWEDGVSVFIELGPQGGCSHAIRAILGSREHVAVSFDIRAGCGVRQLAQALAPVIAAGVPVPGCAALDRLAGQWRDPTPHDGMTLRLPVHRAPIEWPPFEAAIEPGVAHPAAQLMAPPPSMPAIAAAASPPPVAADAVAAAPDLAVLGAHLEQLTRAHRTYLQDVSGAAQRRFLDIAARTAGSALAGGAPAVPPASSSPTATLAPAQMSPPTLDRRALETHASGAIADVFGPAFAPLSAYRRVVRMPEPPLLLADRVVALEGEPATLGLGRVETETDIAPDAWYLHDGRMPPGIMIEAGQADLLLISYLGIDFVNRGERVYRLLGCDLTYHGALPQAGETLRYDIRIDAHARQGDIRLFFFHYDCRSGATPKLTVRNGQAGFFTDAELAESGGVLWDAATATPTPAPRLDPPAVPVAPRGFDAASVQAFADRRPWDCFGPAFAFMATHQRPPAIPGGRMLLFDRVEAFDPSGGPWGRGYLRAVRAVSPDDWFFAGHFKDDPCMPGTLMFEGSLQAMAFYMSAMGATLTRDSWRFEPVPEESFRLICRGQAVPTTRELAIEIFVDEFVAGPTPTLYADLLGTVDGLKAFHCRRMALRLVPDWPLGTRPEALAGYRPAKPVARAGGIDFDYPAMLACAWGPPTAAFGPAYRRYDDGMRPPRLPGPPFHFITRATALDGVLGECRVGSRVEVEYDVPADAWYFAENGTAVMPFCVLLEAALQPCGWLASFVGVPLQSDVELFFRNLDGTATLLAPIPRGARVLGQSVALTGFSRAGGVALTHFDVESRLDGVPVFTMRTSFGYFTAASLEHQAGLPTDQEDRARFGLPQNADMALRTPAGAGSREMPRLARGSLLMLDRISGIWPAGGREGKGAIRGETRISPHDWYFKAHFFQDPVQPGSLGLEAMIQLLQVLMRELGMAAGFARPAFEPVMTGAPVTWKYRGQVLPTRRLMTTEVQIVAAGRDAAGCYAVAEGMLWADGVKIFHMPRFAMRIVETTAAVSGPG